MASPALSFVSGPRSPALCEDTLGDLIGQQAARFGGRTAVVVSWQGRRITYNDLARRSEEVAKAMLARGLKHGDNIAIMAGNCYQYIETFLAAARIGCPFVVLNNTYTPKELLTALKVTSCKLLFIAPKIKLKDLSKHIDTASRNMPDMSCIVLSHDDRIYSSFVSEGRAVDTAAVRRAERGVDRNDILNLQFTSGTTGAPKAAMLSHRNLINNGRFVGDAMQLTPSDIVCCPPPLFHCFGLVMGFLGTFTHGSTIVFPCDQFDAPEVLDALHKEKCTALLGVPTMFIAEVEANKSKRYRISTVRTGLAAGSSVSPAVMNMLEAEFGIKGMLIAYGMTETSPVTFITGLNDNLDRRTKTVGRVLPHTAAKVVDRDGKTVPRGVRGELCTSGYALQRGYFKNPAKTDEVMKKDEDGVLWMYTGDECMIDEEGYCSVTGRIKDIIIRGGENIFPVEIEARLTDHDAITEAAVVAIKDERYGEVVGAFLREKPSCQRRPTFEEVNLWVRSGLGSHKAPRYIFWIGDAGVGDDFPKTGSGKYQKHILRAIGENLIKAQAQQAKKPERNVEVRARL